MVSLNRRITRILILDFIWTLTLTRVPLSPARHPASPPEVAQQIYAPQGAAKSTHPLSDKHTFLDLGGPQNAPGRFTVVKSAEDPSVVIMLANNDLPFTRYPNSIIYYYVILFVNIFLTPRRSPRTKIPFTSCAFGAAEAPIRLLDRRIVLRRAHHTVRLCPLHFCLISNGNKIISYLIEKYCQIILK